MTLEVEVISKEIIKPSSPTPNLLTPFKISLIDQCTPPIGVPLILFYSSLGKHDQCPNTNTSDHLKKSLSETLTKFYPLAGRVKDNNSIVCNDSGVEYFEAHVKCRLYKILNSPEACDLNKLLPSNLHSNGVRSESLLAVQVNVFECGGVAITTRVSHKVADAVTLCSFVNTWAKIAREDSTIEPLHFDSAALFPPGEIPGTEVAKGDAKQKLAVKSFVFSSSKIDALKAKCRNKSHVESPSRVEAVSALIWKCFMKVTSLKLATKKSFMANIAVNLRNRMVPPLSENSFGNLIIGAMPSSATESGADLECLVGHLREAIRKTEYDCSKKLGDGEGVKMFMKSLRHALEMFSKGEVGFFTITSWCRFPFYEADFGFGMPLWISTLNMFHKNVVVLMDTKYGDGIEVMVTLDEDDMVMFECEPELLEFASPK